MPTYNDLSPESYYLIKENEHAGIEMVYVPMTTAKCVLVEYQDEEQTMNWFKKEDEIAEIIEQLSPEQAFIYESLFEEDEEDFDDDDDDDDTDLSSLWENDSDDDDDDEEDINPSGKITFINPTLRN